MLEEFLFHASVGMDHGQRNTAELGKRCDFLGAEKTVLCTSLLVHKRVCGVLQLPADVNSGCKPIRDPTREREALRSVDQNKGPELGLP
jgi:hypothetical protein